jgi:hypothetical protein
LRAAFVEQVMHDIAGRESQPAGQVFKNVQVLKTITAADLVTKMDKEYGEAMGWNCTNCHRLAPQGNWASDTSNNKVRARFMQQMQNDINTRAVAEALSKGHAKDRLRDVSSRLQRATAAVVSPSRSVASPGGMPLPPARGNPPPGAQVSR